MDEDQPAEAGLKRPSEEPQELRILKRKKTVTWADGEELALAAALPPGSGGGGAGKHQQQAQQQQLEPVVVLPADSLYCCLNAAELLSNQVETPQPSSKPLSRQQVLQRRLRAVEQLSSLYEKEMWGLLEELRLRHRQFLQQQPALPLHQAPADAADAAAGCADGADGTGSEPEQQQQQQQQQPAPALEGEQRTAHELWQAHLASQAAAGSPQPAAASAASAASAAPAPAAGSPATAAAQPAGRAEAQQQQHPQGLPSQAAAGAVVAPAPLAHEALSLPTFEEMEQLLLHIQDPAAAAAPAPAAVSAAGAATEAAAAGAGAPPPAEPAEPAEAAQPQEAAGKLDAVEQQLLQQKAEFLRHLQLVGRLEQASLASLCRHLDSHGAMAALVGRANRYLLRKPALVIGRNTESKGSVDIDLSLEGNAQQVSRQQAQLWAEADGSWVLRCTGRRSLLINGREVAQGERAALPHLSLIKVGPLSLLFVCNRAAMARLRARSAAVTA